MESINATAGSMGTGVTSASNNYVPNKKKFVSIQEVNNGFIINLSVSYSKNEQHIAKTGEEVVEIISTFMK